MSAATTLPAAPALTIGSRRVPVLLPKLGDPRLKLSAVIVSLQVLGQTVLDFKLSIAQILITIAFCAVVDTTVTLWRQGVLAWPASALLTGNSTAFILRASGTEHGDWWSLNGIEWFLLAASVALAVKYLVRPGGRHRFNPSNVGLVWVLLVVGPLHVFPQYLYWGPLEAPLVAALAVIVLGAAWVLRAVRMLPMAIAFLAPFTVLIGLFALSGRSFLAIWSEQAIGGFEYWLYIVTSPELLIFVFFMMSDPGTAPKLARARVAFGAGTALIAAALIFFQPTEYGIKVALLASLTVSCALVPLIERLARRGAGVAAEPAFEAATGPDRAHAAGPPPLAARLRAAAARPASVAVALIVALAIAGTASLSDNRDLILIERGEAGPLHAQ